MRDRVRKACGCWLCDPIARLAKYRKERDAAVMEAAMHEASEGDTDPSPLSPYVLARLAAPDGPLFKADPERIFDKEPRNEICSKCGGWGCEEGCGPRGGCEWTYAGPDSHKICSACGGRGKRFFATVDKELTK